MKTMRKRTTQRPGAAQLALFPYEELVRCGGAPAEVRCSPADGVVLDEEDGPEPGHGEADGGMTQCRLVALWHDRGWNPLRFFKRADGATVVVFAVGGAR